MGIIGSVEDKVKSWAFNVALKKAAISLARAAASYALAHSGLLASAGINVNVDPNLAAAGILAGAHIVGSFLAHRFPGSLGWLDMTASGVPATSVPEPANNGESKWQK